MDRTFRTRGGFKVMCWVGAVICSLLVVTVPFAVLALWLAYHGSVRVTDDKIVIRWLGTREHAWSDIASLAWVPAVGLVGGAMRPLTYTLRSKPRAQPRIALGAHEGSEELLATIKQKTGLELTR